MSRLYIALIIVAVAGAASAQSGQQDTTTQTAQPSPQDSKGCGTLSTLSSETCTLLGK